MSLLVSIPLNYPIVCSYKCSHPAPIRIFVVEEGKTAVPSSASSEGDLVDLVVLVFVKIKRIKIRKNN